MNFYSKNYFQRIFLLPLAKIIELAYVEDVNFGFLFSKK